MGGLLQSRWLREAEREQLESGPCSSVAPNARPQVCPYSVARGCARRFASEWWAYATLYAPLRLWKRHPLRAEKYFWATVSSVEMVETAFGGAVPQTRHLHRHAVLTCYLDALVDKSGELGWPLGFGLAVFGLAPAPPPFLEAHDGALREALVHDYPRLRLAAAGEHRGLIVGSLLEAAAVESRKREVPLREHKLLSNLVCIRPFLVSGALVDPSLMEPLAMVYTFFDDALDVLEDLEEGGASHLGTEEGVASGASLARRAVSELNARALGDWSVVGEAAVGLATAAAREQIRRPESYRRAESAAPHVCVRLAIILFAAAAKPRCTRSPFRFAPAPRTT